MSNYHCYFGGGTGGAGGPGYGNGVGGSGGDGMGASLNCDFHGDVVMNNAYHRGESGIHILHRSVALEAIHDATDSFTEPKCHPETRTRMLMDLCKWALDPRPKTTILWLHGPAGAGKSAIMRTLATQLQKDGRLGGCFFFKRGHATRGNAKTLFATIAYQLAFNVELLRTPISRVVEQNPSILVRSIGTQMQELISKPCRAHKHWHPLVIVIDGLDECDGHAFQGEVLRAIRNPSSNHPIFLRFLVASRPEPNIREVFDSSFYSGHCRLVNVEQSFRDVRKYLSDEFARIHREHRTMTNIPLPWPSPEVVWELVRKSSGHFIYASTIIKFIDDKNYRPTQRLAVVQDANGAGSESAFDPLDQLYMNILNSAPRQSDLIPILCAMVHFDVSLREIDQLFCFAEGETRLCLRSLHSLLVVPSDDDGRISSHHASFLDFLDNPGRSRTFCVDTLQHRINLARIILEAYVGPHENADVFWSQFLNCDLMPFIQCLLPSAEVAELLPLIGTIDPECIFTISFNHVPQSMLTWLKEITSASRDLIKLWEDYECMVSLERTVWFGLATERIFPCSLEFLRILVSHVILQCDGLSKLRGQLDLTWAEMRTSICGPSSNLATDALGPAVRLAFRDVALQCIRKMVTNHLDMGAQVYSWETRDAALESVRRTGENHIGVNATYKHIAEQDNLASAISYLVKFSPSCPVLYWELCCIPIDPTWLSGSAFIYHVSKWLESFPDPSMELIDFWNQTQVKLGLKPLDVDDLKYTENEWRDMVNRWNRAIVCLRLPDVLKFPLPI